MAEQIIREYSQEKIFPTALRRISWGAVFAGFVVSIMVSLILSLLGIAIGAATVDPMRETNPMKGLGTGAAIWFAVTILIAYFVGGCVAGRLAGIGRRVDAMLHGVVTWGLTTLFTFFVLTSALGGLLGGVANMLSGIAKTTVAPRMQQAANSSNPTEEMKNQMKQMLQAAGKTPEEANQTVDAWAQKTQSAQISEPSGAEAERTARETGEAVASGTSKAAWGGFVALILGGLAAAFGGTTGVPRDFKDWERTTPTTV